MPPNGSMQCPICGGMLRTLFNASPGARYRVDCNNCGDHWLSHEVADDTWALLGGDATRARVAHALFKVPAAQLVSTGLLQALTENAALPPPLDRVDNLVALLAGVDPPGTPLPLTAMNLRAKLGCESTAAAEWVIVQTEKEGLIESAGPGGHVLTFRGYKMHEERMRAGAGSRHAFMAMDFKAADIREFFGEKLVPGVARTGFQLRTTEHAQKTAGLIDARMRVELHTSRFVVCDLTHNNRGAYWEAGFAEGIGRPVFYLCRSDVMDSVNPEQRPHFDIAHHSIVRWDPLNPTAAVEELVAMIRATLPADAEMEDDERDKNQVR